MSEAVSDWIGAGLVCLSGIMGLLASVAHMEMTDQVNRTRPLEQQVWWGWGLTPRNPDPTTTGYRRLYPDGPLVRRAVTLTGFGLGLFAAGVLLIFPIWLGLAVAFGALAVFGIYVVIAYRR